MSYLYFTHGESQQVLGLQFFSFDDLQKPTLITKQTCFLEHIINAVLYFLFGFFKVVGELSFGFYSFKLLLSTILQ